MLRAETPVSIAQRQTQLRNIADTTERLAKAQPPRSAQNIIINVFAAPAITDKLPIHLAAVNGQRRVYGGLSSHLSGYSRRNLHFAAYRAHGLSQPCRTHIKPGLRRHICHPRGSAGQPQIDYRRVRQVGLPNT